MKQLAFLFFFSTITLFSQNVRVEGIIAEDGKTPLEMANVMAINQATKSMDAYAITNDKGKYLLNLKANSSYTIKLSYVGMAINQSNLLPAQPAVPKIFRWKLAV